jgi:hypothetical protein
VVAAALPGLLSDVSTDPDLLVRVRARFTELFAAVRERLAEAVRRGEVRPGVDPDALVYLIGGATMLTLLQEPGYLATAGWLDSTTSILLQGITT